MNTQDKSATISVATQFLACAARGRARDEAAALLAPGFRHHNVYFAGDGASLLDAMDANARAYPDKVLEVRLAVSDEDMVATYCRVRHEAEGPEYAVAHLFRFENGKIAEMWDCGQEIPKDSPNENGAF